MWHSESFIVYFQLFWVIIMGWELSQKPAIPLEHSSPEWNSFPKDCFYLDFESFYLVFWVVILSTCPDLGSHQQKEASKQFHLAHCRLAFETVTNVTGIDTGLPQSQEWCLSIRFSGSFHALLPYYSLSFCRYFIVGFDTWIAYIPFCFLLPMFHLENNVPFKKKKKRPSSDS